ncbi:MAG: peptide deformylase, partial [Leptospiraceae bacterium]|nr:peptide deformylase [Leptospiraceae bacterium]
MAVRKILRIGHPLLRQKSEKVPVTEIRSSEIKKLLKDMFDSMEAADGVGLAAPQIGVLKR